MGPQEHGAATHVVDRLESYLLGDLGADDEFDVEEHLLRCVPCRTECDHLSGIGLLLAGAPVTVAEPVPALRVLPGGVSTPSRPAARPAADRRARVLLAAAALVLGLVLGGVSWALLAPPSLQGMLAGQDQPSTLLPGRMSVTVADDGAGAAQVQAVVVGMSPDAQYTLLALTRDDARVVTQGRAQGGPERLVGTVPVPADQVVLVVAVLSDGTVVAIGLP